jgi:hypothetical protein
VLNEVRLSGNWEAWLDFFAEAVIVTATQAVDAARQLVDLANEDRDRISGLGRAAASTLGVHRAMMGRPITTSGWLVEKTGITPSTVNKCLGHLDICDRVTAFSASALIESNKANLLIEMVKPIQRIIPVGIDCILKSIPIGPKKIFFGPIFIKVIEL